MADREADQAQADHLIDTGVLRHDLDSRRHPSDGTPIGTKLTRKCPQLSFPIYPTKGGAQLPSTIAPVRPRV